MQDQGKRLLLAVALALGVMLAWQWLFPTAKEEPKPKQPAATGQPVAVAESTSAVGVGLDGKPSAAQPAGPEQLIRLSYPNIEAAFSNHGGVLKSWHLTDRRYD